jgi:hypothetical protein
MLKIRETAKFFVHTYKKTGIKLVLFVIAVKMDFILANSRFTDQMYQPQKNNGNLYYLNLLFVRQFFNQKSQHGIIFLLFGNKLPHLVTLVRTDLTFTPIIKTSK